MNKKTAHHNQGFTAPPIVIIGAVIVILVIIGFASGALKGSFKVSVNNQATPSPVEETQESAKETVEETPAPTSTPAPASTSTFKTFTSEDMNLSFEYPEDWDVKESSDNVTIALMEEGKTNNAAAAITAVSKPLGSVKGLQFSSIVDLQRTALKKEFNVSEFTVDKETKIGEKAAWILEFNGNISGNALTGKYLTTVDDDNMYAITVLADEDKWSRYSADLQKVLDTFKVLK